MKEYIFDKVNESIYKETLDNGIDVYLYPFEDTKNFYCTISVKYGAKCTKYKKNNKMFDVIPGTAHFLEHRIMLIGEDPILSKKINDLGSLANAWTSYDGTNYNIFGSENIKENIKILLDLFHNAKFTKDQVEKEKGIISEEIDMSDDRIETFLSNKINQNAFYNSYAKNTVLGTKEDINKITYKSLKQIYDDFYIPNNTFIVISGNFDKEEIMDYIKLYYGKLKLKIDKIPTIIKEKELENIKINYEEIKKDMEDIRVKYFFKLNKKTFEVEDDFILKSYMNIILKLNFSSTSKLYEIYKNEGLVHSFGAYSSLFDDYIIIVINAITNKPDEFINKIKKDIKKIYISKNDFERVKKKYTKGYIMGFENIEDVEYTVTSEIIQYNKIYFNEYDFLNNISYEKAVDIIKKINTNNDAVIRTTI